MSWAVWCGDGNRWEWDLSKTEADFELGIARAQCQCGYQHRIGSDERNPFTTPQKIRSPYQCHRCWEIGHNSRSCDKDAGRNGTTPS